MAGGIAVKLALFTIFFTMHAHAAIEIIFPDATRLYVALPEHSLLAKIAWHSRLISSLARSIEEDHNREVDDGKRSPMQVFNEVVMATETAMDVLLGQKKGSRYGYESAEERKIREAELRLQVVPLVKELLTIVQAQDAIDELEKTGVFRRFIEANILQKGTGSQQKDAAACINSAPY